MPSSEITLSTTEWTRVTDPGFTGICWKKEGKGVVIDHTDQETAATLPLTNTNVSTGKSKRIPLDSASNAVVAINADNLLDVFYALALVGPAKIAVASTPGQYRTSVDENGAKIPETIDWDVELAQMMAGKKFTQHIEKSLPSIGDSLIIAVTTPSTGIITANFHVLSELQASVEITKNDIISGGAPVVMTNTNDGSSNVASSIVVSDPTIVTPGSILINPRTIGSASAGVFDPGTGGNISGGMRFANSTTYVIKMISATSGNLAHIDIVVSEGL